MVGAFVGISLGMQGWNYLLICFLCGILSGLIGLILDRVFLHRLYRQELMQIILTLGFVYILSNVVEWIWGGQTLPPFSPPIFLGSMSILGLSYPINRFPIIFVALLLGVGLWLFGQKTHMGAIVRAGMDNKEMTMALGINLQLVYTLVFFLGSFIAGVAGIVGAPLMGAYAGLGMDALTLALIVVVIGGLGSVGGAVLASFLVGVIDAFGKAFIPDLAMFTMYLVMIIILLVKPSGLLKGRLM